MNAISAIDIASHTVSATVPSTGFPHQVSITPDGAFACVSNASRFIDVIDTATNTIVATINDIDNPIGMAFLGPARPTSGEQCKNGGWKTFTNPAFRNQGDCVSYVNRRGRS